MTYLGFHARFNLPPTLLLAFLLGRHWEGGLSFFGLNLVAAAIVCLLVFLFASPWDNWAVQQGIWGFTPHRTGRRIGWLPWEEYLFFLWQSVNVVGTVALLFFLRPGWRTGEATPLSPLNGLGVLAILAGWAAVLHWWREKPRSPRWGYAWHLFSWFLPVIAFQWAIAPALLFHQLPVIACAGALWGTYYTVADLVAVRSGIWFFDPKQITGVRLGGILPWEEAAFFYVTSWLVAQSFVMLLPAAGR
ncbi:putative membrane protein [Verrucomicrobium sp. GAS474]|uniref:lycopene cyclase domain-containing protein n=1 Tax=Verrucomicrobium sp. GAS474 TaxID=1882831 RepID=UPI00087B16EC|nr:lycopene cyclase domain-containing protein [Verrucomicrobium sp. GAS474]SDU23847.1 putative membrane protein [Verrucomicrobium sp. GAS474]